MQKSGAAAIGAAELFHKGVRGPHPEKWFHWTCTKCGLQYAFEHQPAEPKPATLDAEEWIGRARRQEALKHYSACKAVSL